MVSSGSQTGRICPALSLAAAIQSNCNCSTTTNRLAKLNSLPQTPISHSPMQLAILLSKQTNQLPPNSTPTSRRLVRPKVPSETCQIKRARGARVRPHRPVAGHCDLVRAPSGGLLSVVARGQFLAGEPIWANCNNFNIAALASGKWPPLASSRRPIKSIID